MQAPRKASALRLTPVEAWEMKLSGGRLKRKQNRVVGLARQMVSTVVTKRTIVGTSMNHRLTAGYEAIVHGRF
jgi:hypothetical protein